MRIATWNVNSVRARCPRILEFLAREQVDVLAMQEIKCRPDQFPTAEFQQQGWSVVAHGLNQWNGVAIAVRDSVAKISEVEENFPGQPAYGNPGKPAVVEARALRAKIVAAEGTDSKNSFTPFEVYSLYVPNGRELDHPHYQYKLDWLAALAQVVQERLSADPQTQLALVGDWNVAPLNTDVWDINVFAGCTHVSAAERAAFNKFSDLGLSEVTRDFYSDYTYFDYKQLRFPRNEGMKIDFAYCTPALTARVTNAYGDREERKGKGASDHLPVIIEID